MTNATATATATIAASKISSKDYTRPRELFFLDKNITHENFMNNIYIILIVFLMVASIVFSF